MNEEESDEIVPHCNDVMIGRSCGARHHFGTQRFYGMCNRCSMHLSK
jgi:hypothetical protein